MLLPAAVLSLTLLLSPGMLLAQAVTTPLQGTPQKTLQQVKPPAPLLPGKPKSAGQPRTNPYLDSAHGSPEEGVLRQEKAREGFARANCSHCHDFHGESDSSGSSGGRNKAYPYTLYAQNFDSKTRTGVYTEPVNICFSCHNANGSAMRLSAGEFSKTYGCGTLAGPTDILAAFNQKSRHNLYDIWKHLDTENKNYPWVTKETNPCSACHNPHLARNHSDNPRDAAFSSLSRPGDHSSLWTQSMGDAFATQYEPPFCSNEDNREPAATSRDDLARAAMVDYVTFCTDCHDARKPVNSTPFERNLLRIDWSLNGEVHGGKAASAALAVKPPYLVDNRRNYVLSCLDCHDPHGSANSALLRNWVNGGKLLGSIALPLTTLPGTGTDTQNTEMGFLCMRCHEQDAESGTSAVNPPRWQTVHHGALDGPLVPLAGATPPYAMADCAACHQMESGAEEKPLPIECINCHFHGSTDGWLEEQATKRITF
ncbi:MAG: cytochrome c3 family protein [Thermodesulfobacteriota bacterium]